MDELWSLHENVHVETAPDGSLIVHSHYDPRGHLLKRLDVTEAEAGELLDNARVAAGLDRRPAVLLTVTARFGRIFWRYEGPGYTLVQREVGSVLHLLGLVGTAMGLPGCSQDSSDIELVSRIFRTDWRAESAVGEFVIGSKPTSDPGQEAHRDVNDACWPTCARSFLSRKSPYSA